MIYNVSDPSKVETISLLDFIDLKNLASVFFSLVIRTLEKDRFTALVVHGELIKSTIEKGRGSQIMVQEN